MGKKDITQKSFFENAEWFADLMNAAFFGGEEILVAEELQQEKENESEKKEEDDVCEAIQGMIDEGKEEGIRIGKVAGRAEGKAESIIFLLNQKGQLSKPTEDRISKEKNNDILVKWLLLAANAESISAFEAAM